MIEILAIGALLCALGTKGLINTFLWNGQCFLLMTIKIWNVCAQQTIEFHEFLFIVSENEVIDANIIWDVTKKVVSIKTILLFLKHDFSHYYGHTISVHFPLYLQCKTNALFDML